MVYIVSHDVYIFKKDRLRLLFLYFLYSTFFIGLNIWFIVREDIGFDFLIITILIFLILLVKDLKSKIIIDGDIIYYERLMRKRSFPIHDIARIYKGETSSGSHARFVYIYVQDKNLKYIFELPESLPRKKDFDTFEERIHAVNPDVSINLYKKERKLF